MFAKASPQVFPSGVAGFSAWSRAVAAHPGENFSIQVKRVKLLLRLLLFQRHHRKVEAIFARPSLFQIMAANPRIVEKPYRDYLFTGTGLAERVRMIEESYRFVEESFPPSWIRSIFVERDFTLATLDLPGTAPLAVRLHYQDRFEKEGELTLALYDTERRLYSATFSLLAGSRRRSAIVGCLIGPETTGSSSEQDLDAIRQLTKSLHGLRPQNLVFFLLQSLCRHLGVEDLRGVSCRTHVYGGSAKKRDRIKFDYDRFWEEIGGEPAQQAGLFTLPIQHARRPIADIRSNKRAAYQRRYALLDDLDRQVRQALHLPMVPARPDEQPLVKGACAAA
ncbi:VirK/YbjX family protein [Geomesophilobacter sediminis]|uniref:DUF535 domain-containing protein n=1 Tax=Geomesophilobacter sediminis TaxID=2798584 RepID=A0A8J7IR22_9BACT|nr:DUF535 family protein [Geomesophilobacter sediminis]MBJ6726468.1 DUF535 domain-containing protein [Geomesophilobacter sediminis]